MHGILLKKCRQPLTVYSLLNVEDGDKYFKDPIVLKCFSEPKVQIVRDKDGQEVVSDTTIFLNGTDVNSLGTDDEIELQFLGRREIKNIQVFPALKGDGYDHLEVYV